MNVFFRAVPWLAVLSVVLLGACQSRQVPGWMQGGSGKPVASAPPPARVPPPAPAPAPEATPTPAPVTAVPASPAPAAWPPAAGPPPSQPWAAASPDDSVAQRPLEPFLYRPAPEAPGPVPPQSPAPPKVTGVRVALLLPLSGSQSGLAAAMLNAAQLALFDFADERMELLIHDTRGTPEGAAEAAALAIGDGASVILGPLLASSVRAVTPAARAANVTVLGFSSDRSVAGDGVFTMGFLPEAEVQRVVAFARSRGLRRFAALAPDNEYGEKVVAALGRAAEGAVVSRIQFYDPGASDFSAAVRRLADYEARRGALVSQRSQLRARDDEIARRALRRLAKLQTVGDLPFDALLVADGGRRLQAIAALLPFFDVDPAKIKMLGTGRWEEPGLGAEPALVGGWFAAPPPAARAGFEARYLKTYGKPPHRLATLAYDATALAAVLAKDGSDFSAEALTQASGFWGRDGIFRLLPEGVTERGLAVLQVLPRGFKVISEAPETFEPAIY